MLVSPAVFARITLALLAMTTPPAYAEDRTELNACKAMVDRAARDAKTASVKPEDAELTRCRQIVREWMLRDARRSVDEEGRPLR